MVVVVVVGGRAGLPLPPFPLPPPPRRGMLSTNLSVGREMLSIKGCIFLVTPLILLVIRERERDFTTTTTTTTNWELLVKKVVVIVVKII